MHKEPKYLLNNMSQRNIYNLERGATKTHN